MYPTHVAVVPYREGLVPTGELLHVASALQTQAIRDLGPLWDVSAVVSPFLRLDDVPPGYVPLVIIEGLPSPWHGFHDTRGGELLALIAYQRDWSILASHELLELLCDPSGNRRLPGRSLEKSQGPVEYLVEVCDPCQEDGYTINGVAVSDFVTPHYYGPVETTGARYCFTGGMAHALEVRAGGSITWRTPDGETWEKSGRRKPSLLHKSGLSRAGVDANRAKRGAEGTNGVQKKPPGRPQRYVLEPSAQQYGKRLRATIERLLRQLGVRSQPSSVEAIIKLLEGFAVDNSAARKNYKKDPEGELRKRGIDLPSDRSVLTEKLAPAEHYHGLIDAIRGGAGLGDSKLVDHLMTLSAFHH